ncbi:MAG: hypothetical protein IJ766_01295 [Clostridia bacterium]|nr:hypothetical protein [Clostridia bacterium]
MNYGNSDAEPILEIVAGDDCTVCVDFTAETAAQTPILGANDRLQMVLTAENAYEITGTAQGDTGVFYLSAALTEAIAAEGCEIVRCCVHIFWAGGGRSTPIFDRPVRILRCPAQASAAQIAVEG